jgi:hypothetical protein
MDRLTCVLMLGGLSIAAFVAANDLRSPALFVAGAAFFIAALAEWFPERGRRR